MKDTAFFEVLKWGAAVCFILATFIMFSPTLAATSILPWTFFLIGNVIWWTDSYYSKNTPWVIIATIFCILDIILIWARLNDVNIIRYIEPSLLAIEKVLT